MFRYEQRFCCCLALGGWKVISFSSVLSGHVAAIEIFAAGELRFRSQNTCTEEWTASVGYI